MAILPLVVTAPRWLPEQEEGKVVLAASILPVADAAREPLIIGVTTD
jgi:hypothetical protein